MNKSIQSRFNYLYPIFYFVILFIPIYLISLSGFKQLFSLNDANITLSILQKLFFIALPLIVAIFKLRSLKSLEIRNEEIIINYPFAFKTSYYPISKLKDLKVEIIKPEGNGPGFIERPFKKVTLVFNNKSISFTSKINKNVEAFINFLNSIKTI